MKCIWCVVSVRGACAIKVACLVSGVCPSEVCKLEYVCDEWFVSVGCALWSVCGKWSVSERCVHCVMCGVVCV